MKKIVINKCYGGFGISHEAMVKYGIAKGTPFYIELSHSFTSYYTAPKDENGIYPEGSYFSDLDIERDDPYLIHVIEEMGTEEASARYAKLKIVEIPDDIEWEIEEYDGVEWISEIHQTWS